MESGVGEDRDDLVSHLVAQIEKLTAVIAQLEERLARVERERDEYRKLYELVREENERLKRGLIGQKAHRAPDDAQLSLAILGLALGAEQEQQPETSGQPVASHTRQRPVRKPFPEHIERVRFELLPAEVEREGRDAFDEIGVERREVLERRPASLVVVEVVKPKFVRKSERGALRTEVLVAPTPELPIERGTAGPGLLADTIVKRWQDALPLNRQEGIYRRDGIELNRSTLATWHGALADLARPLVEAMHRDALAQPYVCVDATGVLVRHPQRCKRGHFWVLVAPGRHVLYQFSLQHDGAAVDRLLPDYRGVIVADAHKVYDHLFGDGKATEAGCWSHLRQYVLEAMAIDPERVRDALACVQALFMIERGIDRAPPGERARVREEKSRPIVGRFFEWCDEQRDGALEGSPLHDAIRYATNQKEALARFLDDARLPLHNNISELHLRRQAVGRKNWLFAGSERGGEACAIVTSLIETAKAHGHDPLAYLTDVLERLPTTLNRDIESLLPMKWRASGA